MYRNATYAFTNLLWMVLSQGTEITVRGSKVTELLAQSIDIAWPKERCYILPHRNDNIFAKIFETLWVIAGKNSIDSLSYYLPRASDYSDDGKTWRGGYGQRLRNWDGEHDGVDQIECAIHAINNDKYTRRAVNIIYDPALDFVDSKDIPCNNLIHWLVRPEKNTYATYDPHSTVDRLHMMIAQRSSDILWGFSGINTFEWSVLQEMMAYWTGTEVGPLHYFISSLHLYEKHWERAEKMLDRPRMQTIYDLGITSPQFSTSFDDIDDTFDALFMAEHMMRVENKISKDLGLNDLFLDSCWEMLKIHYYLKTYPGQHVWQIRDIINAMPTSDFKIAAIHYLATQGKATNIIDDLDLTDLEKHALALGQ